MSDAAQPAPPIAAHAPPGPVVAPVSSPLGSAMPGSAAPAPTPPARRFGFDPATRRPTVIVAAVIAALFFGSQLVNEALPGGTAVVAAGETVNVGGAVTLTAVAGWQRTDLESGGVRLEKGTVVFDLFPETVTSNGRGLAEAYLEQVLRAASTELTSTDFELATEGTSTGARFRYQGIFTGAEGPIEGEVTAVVNGGNGVVADGWTRQGNLDTLLEEIRRMVASIEVSG